ncbi:hypothetical protein HYS91_01115 [Candidatus Daviesbacteria bacterium]|nr:hypothetical protein [Candidatus Daviesbacteria bacterium]
MSFLDKLPKLPFFSPKSSENEYFFALNIDQTQVQASLWSLENNQLKLVNIALANIEDGKLIEAANLSLDETLGALEIEPSKILFGVPDSWLQDDNLKEEHLKTIKDLVKELDLSPMAYVSSAHAISHLLQKIQGVPLTAILVNISDPLIITIVKAGKIIGSESVRRSDNLAKDIEKGLLTFSEVEVLPSKILLFGPTGSVNGEKLKDDLLSFPWMSNLPFLHLPKVDILDQKVTIAAVSFAGASELNPDTTFGEKDLNNLTTKEVKKQEIASLDSPHSHDSLKEVGFVQGNIEEESFDSSSTSFTANAQDKEEKQLMDEGLEIDEQEKDFIRKDIIPPNYLAKLSTSLPLVIKNKITSFRFQFVPKVWLLPILILIILIVSYLFIPHAKVTIFIDPRILEKEAQVIVDPEVTSVDESNRKIPGKRVETVLTGFERGVASGKKKIGDPSKGAVVIYNKTTSPKTFSQGSILVGDNIQFTLDSTVNIASESAVEGGIAFGKATANVTAAQIGPEGNLPAGKELSIQGQSSDNFSAKVDSTFSGGTSKDVTIVTSDDQKKLLAIASSNLRKKAKDNLQAKLSGDYKVLEEALSEENAKTTYSKNINDQGVDFTLNLSLKFTGTAYSDMDLKRMVSKLVETNVPPGFSLDLADTETQADVAKMEDDGKLIFLAKFKAKLMPKLDEENIKKKIAFKTPTDAASILRSIENVISSDIQINPALPSFLQRLPFLASRISLDVTAK